MSIWEVGMLVDKKRIEMTIDISDWVDQALDDPGIQFCPITPDIAIKAQDYQEDFMEIP
ncbi:MAG: type II toxin-antitoxin system VapC family toxin [Chlamydiae bacterium]|nr:type II toxin-antitoxin system VapC family toxin [Chlamydiota bacterium]